MIVGLPVAVFHIVSELTGTHTTEIRTIISLLVLGFLLCVWASSTYVNHDRSGSFHYDTDDFTFKTKNIGSDRTGLYPAI